MTRSYDRVIRQIAPGTRTSGRAGRAQAGQGLGDPPLPRCRGLGVFDRENVALLAGVGKLAERRPGGGVAVERGSEVSGNGDLARGGVQLDGDVHLIAGRDAGPLAYGGADRELELAVHPGDGRLVGVPRERDADRGT